MERYLQNNTIYPHLIKEKPTPNINIIVIIPAFNEPDIINTLISLALCNKPKLSCEAIIVFNDSETTPNSIIETNRQTLKKVEKWKNENNPFFKLFAIHISNLPAKHSGVGLARKIAMDEACRRFNSINNPNGVIVSLDADCTVSKNYFTEIENSFLKTKTINCAVFNFEHDTNPEIYNTETIGAITKYESHLRYFNLALKYTQFPYAFHTIGSCFAVRAITYSQQGGMNKKQGGEDFYFLHKIFTLNKTKYIYNIYVQPASRTSNRVPFGTGPAISKIMHETELYTYNPNAFIKLRTFFEQVEKFYKANPEVLRQLYCNFDSAIKYYLKEDDFIKAINEINCNCVSKVIFTKKFFSWFNAFKIIKYLNHTHTSYFEKKAISIAATNLLNHIYNIYTNNNMEDILKELRKIESNPNLYPLQQ